MAGAGKSGLGIGTAALGGAASGAAFGPIGAGIGAGVGGLLGLMGAMGDPSEEDLERQRQKARKMAAVEVLRNRAARYGAPTDDLDMKLKLAAIDDRYQAQQDQLNQVTPQDIMAFGQAGASLGGNIKNWTAAPAAPAGEVIRNSDLYGTPDTQTGLTRSDADIITDPMEEAAKRRAMAGLTGMRH